MATFAGKTCGPLQIRTTIDFLARLRRTDRPLAARIIMVAINRKAGIPDVACRKQDSDHQARYYRDARRLMAKKRHRVRVYQFETKEVRDRFSHLLDRYDD